MDNETVCINDIKISIFLVLFYIICNIFIYKQIFLYEDC